MASKQPVQQEVEWRLFHGTGIQNVRSIVKHGFDLNRASHTSLYGRGIYFAESSEKADQYADPPRNRRNNDLTMFVVRVKPGVVKSYESDDVTPPRKTSCFERVYHMTPPTNMAGMEKRFREVVVHEQERCLPEYLIVYDRQ